MAEMEAGQVLHISDLKLPKGVTSVALSHGADHDQAVVAINLPKKGKEEAEDSAEAESEGEGE